MTIEGAISKYRRGVKPSRNREIISGVDNWSINRRSKARIWASRFEKFVVDIQCIDSTTVKAQPLHRRWKTGRRR